MSLWIIFKRFEADAKSGVNFCVDLAIRMREQKLAE
jgi:hypothetical protein